MSLTMDLSCFSYLAKSGYSFFVACWENGNLSLLSSGRKFGTNKKADPPREKHQLVRVMTIELAKGAPIIQWA